MNKAEIKEQIKKLVDELAIADNDGSIPIPEYRNTYKKYDCHSCTYLKADSDEMLRICTYYSINLAHCHGYCPKHSITNHK